MESPTKKKAPSNSTANPTFSLKPVSTFLTTDPNLDFVVELADKETTLVPVSEGDISTVSKIKGESNEMFKQMDGTMDKYGLDQLGSKTRGIQTKASRVPTY